MLLEDLVDFPLITMVIVYFLLVAFIHFLTNSYIQCLIELSGTLLAGAVFFAGEDVLESGNLTFDILIDKVKCEYQS